MPDFLVFYKLAAKQAKINFLILQFYNSKILIFSTPALTAG